MVLATLDGLLYGCGDAVIGVNPATESVETVANLLRILDHVITALDIPTQACCLAHITTQLACLARGVPVDLLFQSIAGTSLPIPALASPSTCCAKARSASWSNTASARLSGLVIRSCTSKRARGAPLSAGAHHGIDQLTLEARAYGLARAFRPFPGQQRGGFHRAGIPL